MSELWPVLVLLPDPAHSWAAHALWNRPPALPQSDSSSLCFSPSCTRVGVLVARHRQALLTP